MASLTKKGKHFTVRLSPSESDQRSRIALGSCGKRMADRSKGCIESLIAGGMTEAIQLWLKESPVGVRKRLEQLGLIESQEGTRLTVTAFVAKYIESRTDVKAGTRRRLHDVELKVNGFFKGMCMKDVTTQNAIDFKIWLKTVRGLGENTARRHIGMCRQFFNAAVKGRIIPENPFVDSQLPVTVRPNEARFFYVTPEIAQQVLDACPDAQWRLIFGLARYGGLRCPSEVLRLKWEDVDFENEHFIVHSTKTEHHANGGIRKVPMFPELRPLLQDAFDAAPVGSVYCIEKTRDNSVNLRTHMCRIIRRAGLVPWPKLFQNCRSTRETELFKMTGNVKAVCTWIGNSPIVAMNHYAQVTEADMKEAAAVTVLKSAEKDVAKGGRCGGQNVSETGRTVRNEEKNNGSEGSDKPCDFHHLPNNSEQFHILDQTGPLGRAGFEPA